MGLSLLLLAPLLTTTAAPPDRFGDADVTHLAFGPDGKTLTAAYFRHAVNRPGTDWHTFAVTWDLATGRPTRLADATGPVAYSPDGKTLATGRAERNRRPGFRQHPYVRLALWTPGEAEPATTFTAPSDPGPEANGERKSDAGTVLAFAFHPGGKHLAVASADQLWWQPLDGKPQTVAPAPSKPGVAQLAFADDGKSLRFTHRIGDAPGNVATRTWRVEIGEKETKFTVAGREEAKEEPAKGIVAASPDGKMKAVASGPVVIVTDTKTGEKIRELKP